MQLKALEIIGFKSFADRTKFLFVDGVTGIVGPNGCGKSNVIDAFRWVLGAQKTSQLRSEKMENVIFNGTAKRKRANLAEVSVTFENTKNILPTAYASVTVTRKLYRDGESEYRLNDVPCRLKDILNLFMDTGIGPDSYAIIELGMVSDILTDKNDARRTLFEEAAGISKYKVKKREALGKLDDCQLNLERVEDLLFEIEKNLKNLEKQAKRAEKYFQLKAEYKRTFLQHCLLQSGAMLGRKQGILDRLQTVSDELLALGTRIVGHDAQVSDMQLALVGREKDLADYQRFFNRHTEAIQKKEADKNIRAERLRFLQARERDAQLRIEALREEATKLQAALRTLEDAIDEANEEYDRHESRLGELDGVLEDLRVSVKNRQQLVEGQQQELRTKERLLQNLEKDAGYLTIQMQGLMGELERSEQDRMARRDEADGFALRIAELEAEAERRWSGLEALRTHKTTVEDEQRIVTQQIDAHNDARLNTQRKLDALQNEYRLTKSLVESLEGFPDSIKFLKKADGWAAKPVLLSDVFYTEEPYKLALENYLEPYLNYYVVDSRREAYAAIQLLRNGSKGRANFFVLEALGPVAPPMGVIIGLEPPLRPLLGIVEYESKYEGLARHLLGSAHLHTGELGIALADFPVGLSVVHQSGSVLVRDAQIAGGSVNLFQGKRIGRAKNLERLQIQIATLHTQLAAQDDEALRLKSRQLELNSDCTHTQIEAGSRELNMLKQELSVLKAKEGEYQNFLGRIGKREQDVRQEIHKLAQQRDSLGPREQELQDAVNQLQKMLHLNQRELAERGQDLSEITQEHTTANLSFNDAKNQVANFKKEFLLTRERREQNRAQMDALVADLAQARADLHAMVCTHAESDDEMLALYEKKRGMAAELSRLEEGLAQVKTAIRTHEDKIRGDRNAKDNLTAERQHLRDEETRINIALEGLNQRLDYEFQLKLGDLDAEFVFGEPSIPGTSDSLGLANQVATLRDALNGYAEVNPTAIESYREIKQRFDFINDQRTDLLKAKADLLQTIAEIDQSAQARFLETFNAVRNNFIRVFQSLFSQDDRCDLVLKDGSNPLDSAIEIIAQPKGKRPLTINQLSGGEKTLTAISLLFSIYLIKPAPFCIFDEVDAPLDDANIDKFNRIITEFSANSQFILVTHNKRTMTKTNIMYGVTMDEPGVSRVLPVDLVALNLN